MAEAPSRYCGNCGNELRPEDQFCPNCGKPVHETAKVPTPEADVPVPPLPSPEQAPTVGVGRPTRDEMSVEGDTETRGPIGTVVDFLGAGGIVVSSLILIVFLSTLFSGDVGSAFSFLLVAGVVLVFVILR